MRKKISASDLEDRAAFDRRVSTDDGYGNTVGSWSQQFTRWALFVHKGGIETVQAARLDGRNAIGIWLRSDAMTRSIASGWQMRDVRRGTAYNITHVDAVTEREWVYLEATSGVATG